MKKMKLVVFAMVLVFTTFGGYILNDYINKPKEIEYYQNIYKPPQIFKPELKTDVSDILIQGVHGSNKIITTEINLNSELLIDDSYMDLDILKKQQVVGFYAVALFATDLEGMTKQDILISDTAKTIIIGVEAPKLISINMDTDKTMVYEPNNGMFRFGEIKLSAEKFNEVQTIAQTNMAEQLTSYEFEQKCLETSRQSLQSLFGTILDAAGFGEYEVSITFKQGGKTND